MVDDAILRRLLRHTSLEPGPIQIKEGKQNLLARLSGYNNAARFSPWVVLLDLNSDAPCASEYRGNLLPAESDFMNLRIAVRQVEAWLLADRGHVARFLSVSAERIPRAPEGAVNSKLAMVNIARGSRSRAIVADMVPREGSGRSTGPAYPSRLIEFIDTRWDPDAAEQHSPSLSSCLNRLRQL
jgi:hypothetical protein